MPRLGLLDRARKLMSGRASAPMARAQFYRVACASGHVLEGRRTDGYQALRCPDCGEGIFVLPRSPLPEPAPPASAAGRSRASVTRPRSFDDDPLVLTDPPPMRRDVAEPVAADAADDAPAQIEWVDDEPESSPRLTPYTPETSLRPDPAEVKSAPTEPKPSSGAGPKPKRRPKPEPREVPAGMIEVDDRASPAGWVARHRIPLVLFAVVGLVGLTVGLRWRKARLEDLPKVAEIGRIQGLARLDEGEFHVAKKLLGDASAAVDSLGGLYEGADAIRQGAREAAIFADLVREPLNVLVEMAAKYQPADAWPARFDALYRGQSILVDAQVIEAPDPARPASAYDVDHRIYFGNNATPAGKGRLDLKGFRLFEQSRPKVGDVKVFGARLATITLDVTSGYYLIALEPDSGVFITHYKALEVLGWPSPDLPADGEER